MPKYAPKDPARLGRLFRDLIFARQIVVEGRSKVVEEITHSSLKREVEQALLTLMDKPDLLEQFHAFVHDPKCRKEILAEHTAKRLIGSGYDNDVQDLDNEDMKTFNVVLDSPHTFHIALPDTLMSIEQYVDPNWIETMGAYILRKCR